MTLAGGVKHRELKLRAGYVLVGAVLKPDDDVLAIPKWNICARDGSLQWTVDRRTAVLGGTQ
jgi:hypothetical protein